MIIDNMKLKEEARLEILTASNDTALSAETQRQKKQKKIKKTNKQKENNNNSLSNEGPPRGTTM